MLVESVVDARLRIARGRDEGIVCPCCGQFAKVYKRKLNSAMARALILLYRYTRDERLDEWVHFPSFLARNSQDRSDEAKLLHWKLIEAFEGERDDGSKRVGYYRITERGKSFARGELEVPRHALIYNQECIGFGDEMTTIRDALGDRFNYTELMS